MKKLIKRETLPTSSNGGFKSQEILKINNQVFKISIKSDNYLNQSSVTLYKYDGNQFHNLYNRNLKEDENITYQDISLATKSFDNIYKLIIKLAKDIQSCSKQ